MSRIGKKIIDIPDGVEVKGSGELVTVKGPKGELSLQIGAGFSVSQQEKELTVIKAKQGKDANARHGLYRSLIANMVEGVTKGYTIKLELVGVGYRVQKSGNDLQFSLGFSHPVVINAPDGIQFETEGQSKLSINGIDKQLVGQVAANIRKLRKPDPYKGKGVLLEGQVIKRKAGKRV